MSRSETGKLIALDVGLKRIGVAVCDPLRLAARPLIVIQRRSRNEDFADLAAIIQKEEAVAVICGLPLNMDGSEGERAISVRKWAMKLAHALRALMGVPVPILFWDERLSTFAANQSMQNQRNAGVKQSVEEDAVAAAIILQNYLDAKAEGGTQDFGQIVLPEKE